MLYNLTKNSVQNFKKNLFFRGKVIQKKNSEKKNQFEKMIVCLSKHFRIIDALNITSLL